MVFEENSGRNLLKARNVFQKWLVRLHPHHFTPFSNICVETSRPATARLKRMEVDAAGPRPYRGDLARDVAVIAAVIKGPPAPLLDLLSTAVCLCLAAAGTRVGGARLGSVAVDFLSARARKNLSILGVATRFPCVTCRRY